MPTQSPYTGYKNPEDAKSGLTSAFNPTSDAQRKAIDQAASLVPNTGGRTIKATGETATPGSIVIGEDALPYNPNDTGPGSRFYRDPSLQTPSSGDALRDKLTQTYTDTPSLEAARSREIEMADKQIAAIEATYANRLLEEAGLASERDKRTRALNLSSGLGGSEFGSSQAQKTSDYNSKIRQSIVAEQQAKIAEVLSGIEDRASKRYAEQVDLFRSEAESALAVRQQFQDAARQDMVALANSGVTLGDLKLKDPEAYNQLQEESGYESFVFDAIYNQNLPAEERLEFKYFNQGNGVITRFDQFGNQETFKTDIPENMEFKMATDGTPLLFNPNTGELAVADGFSQGQFAKPTSGSSPEKKGELYDLAIQYVQDNPYMTDEEIKQELLADGELSVSQVNAILAARDPLDSFIRQRAQQLKDAGETDWKSARDIITKELQDNNVSYTKRANDSEEKSGFYDKKDLKGLIKDIF